MEGIDREARPAGRTFVALVAGDTAEEIELAALDAAREFFGAGPQLEVMRNYKVGPVGGFSPHAPSGKKYCAEVPVRTIEAGE